MTDNTLNEIAQQNVESIVPALPNSNILSSAEVKDIFTALAKAQGKIENAKKDAENPHFNKKYADLAGILDVAREPLTENGLSVMHILAPANNGNLFMHTILTHTSGQWLKSTYPILPVKNDPQGYGSAITYARRYTLSALVGIAQEDDDGNAASVKPKAKNWTVSVPLSGIDEPDWLVFKRGYTNLLSLCETPYDVEVLKKANSKAIKQMEVESPIDWNELVTETKATAQRLM